MSKYRTKKTQTIDDEVWDRYLEHKRGRILAYGLSSYRVNEGIKATFDAWYAQLDPMPELELRAGFLERLRQTNWLGDVLCRWRRMEDHVAKPNGEEFSREDALMATVRMFRQNYFEPLGISAHVQIQLQACDMSKKKNQRNPAYYCVKTGKIFLKVDKHAYGKSVNERADLSIKAICSDWNTHPDKLILLVIEELSHKFDHEVCKKYMAGEFPADSPWNGYARTLMPQFIGTPSTHLYGSNYYMLNPVERRIEGLLDEVHKIMYQAHQQAKHHAKQAEFGKSGRETTGTAGTITLDTDSSILEVSPTFGDDEYLRTLGDEFPRKKDLEPFFEAWLSSQPVHRSKPLFTILAK
jgi:hypothetical protein